MESIECADSMWSVWRVYEQYMQSAWRVHGDYVEIT